MTTILQQPRAAFFASGRHNTYALHHAPASIPVSSGPALVEKERTMIAARTEAGLSAKARGTKLGMTAHLATEVRTIAAIGAKANQTAAVGRIETPCARKNFDFALKGDVSLRQAAEHP